MFKDLEAGLKNATGEKEIDQLLQLSNKCLENDTEKAKDYSKKALDKCKLLDNTDLLEKCNFYYGYIHYISEDYLTAISYFKEALKLNALTESPQRRGTVLNNIGISMFNIGDFAKCLEYYFESLKLWQKYGPEQHVANIHLSIGLAFCSMDMPDKALSHYEEAAGIYKSLGDDAGLAKTSIDIGQIYKQRKDLPKAKALFEKALEYFKHKNERTGIAIALENIGDIYRLQGNYSKSIDYFRKAMDIISSLKSIDRTQKDDDTLPNSIEVNCLLATNYEVLGKVLMLNGDFEESEHYLNAALMIANKLDLKENKKDLYEQFALLFERKEEYIQALNYHRQYIEIRDELFRQNYTKNLADMQVRYEADKKEKEAAINHLKNVELEEKNKLITTQKKELEKKNKELYIQAITDRLTGIYNRTYIMEFFQKEFANTKRHSQELSIIMFDIDDFKKINDNYGHLAGDAVLSQISACVNRMLRRDDVFGRYGGEEFLIIMPNTPLSGAISVTEKLISEVRKEKYTAHHIFVTASFGIANYREGVHSGISDLIRHADHAMYNAKSKGKNRAVVYK